MNKKELEILVDLQEQYIEDLEDDLDACYSLISLDTQALNTYKKRLSEFRKINDIIREDSKFNLVITGLFTGLIGFCISYAMFVLR